MMDELKNNYEKWNNSNQESLWGGGGGGVKHFCFWGIV